MATTFYIIEVRPLATGSTIASARRVPVLLVRRHGAGTDDCLGALAVTALATSSGRSRRWRLRRGVLGGRPLRADYEYLFADRAAGDRGRAVAGNVGAVREVEVAAFGLQMPDLGGGSAGAGQ